MEMVYQNIQGLKLCFLDTIGIIKSAIKIPFRNPSFITLTFLTSLPLFCAMLVDELLIQKESITLKEKISLVLALYHEFAAKLLIQETSVKLLQADLRYMIFFDLLNLIVTVITVYSASAIYSGGRSTGLRKMLQNSIIKTRWLVPLLAFSYRSFLFYFFWVALSFWTSAGPLLMSENVLTGLIWVMVFFIVSVKWLEYTVSCNIGVVVTILEEKNKFMTRSAYLIEGNRLCGSVLMFLNFVWWSSSIILTQNVRGSFPERVVCALLQTCLLCVGKVMLWSVCMVYYYDCRRRHGEKVDSDDGGLI